MSVFLTAQDPAISYSQSTVIPLAGVIEMTVMQRFIVPDGIATPDEFGVSNGFFGYRLTSSAAGLLSCLWRTANPSVNQGTIIAAGVQSGDELTVYTRITLGESDGVEFYVNGAAAGTTEAGADWVGSTFQLTLEGATARDQELLETAVWVNSKPSVADITNNVDPLSQTVPPTHYYGFDGPNGTHAEPVPDLLGSNNLVQQTGAVIAPNWPYYVGAAQSIVNVDGDNTVQDGQGSATVEVAGFSSDITSVTVTDGTYTTTNLITGGSGTSFTWLMSDIVAIDGDSLAGQPNWMLGDLELVASDGVDSASLSFTWNPVAGWNSNSITGNTTQQGSISENRGAPYPDGSSSYFPTSDDTSVDAAGLIFTSKTENFIIKAWAEDTGVIEEISIIVAGGGGGGGGYNGSLSLGIGLALTMIRRGGGAVEPVAPEQLTFNS